MNRSLSACLLVVSFLGTSVCFGQAPADEIPAPITYKDLMLVLVTAEGAAAIVFPAGVEEKDGSVHYSYRYESRDGTVRKSGKSQVSEKRKPGTDREVERNPDGSIAGVQYLGAGAISLQWSAGSAESGYVYYAPERIKVHIAHAQHFEDSTVPAPFGADGKIKALDLRRYLK